MRSSCETRHQEVALDRLGLGEPGRHLPEPRRQVRELARRAARARRRRSCPRATSSAARDKLQQRTHELQREVPRNKAGDQDADQSRDQQASDQIPHAMGDVGLRRGDDELADRGLADQDRVGDGVDTCGWCRAA